jgi:hypothetical protein
VKVSQKVEENWEGPDRYGLKMWRMIYESWSAEMEAKTSNIEHVHVVQEAKNLGG